MSSAAGSRGSTSRPKTDFARAALAAARLAGRQARVRALGGTTRGPRRKASSAPRSRTPRGRG